MTYNESLLHFTPKGTYYETAAEQIATMERTWDAFMAEDRVLFALAALLPGSVYAKQRMVFRMLSRRVTEPERESALSDGIDLDATEPEIALHLFRDMRTGQALRSLMVLVKERVNNRRTRRLILQYLFDQPKTGYVNLAARYKPKFRALARHALGGDLGPILNGDYKRARRLLGSGVHEKVAVLRFIFANTVSGLSTGVARKLLPIYDLRWKATVGPAAFVDGLSPSIPFEIAVGLRNCYRKDVPMSVLHEKCGKTARQAALTERSAKDHGVKTLVDNSALSLYEVWKRYYFKLLAKDFDGLEEIRKEIDKKATFKYDVRFGRTTIILDTSASMKGSTERPLHPLLVGLCIVSMLPDIVSVCYVGGAFMQVGADDMVVVPAEASNIALAFLNAMKDGSQTIVLISDGYENQMKGATNRAYHDLIADGKTARVIHINPVYAADAKHAGRRVIDEVRPILLERPEDFKGAYLTALMLENTKTAKRELLRQYRFMIGRERGEKEFMLT